MQLSRFFRKSALSIGVAVASTLSVSAQDLFVTNGGQYSISGAMPGGQIFPRLAINSGGGFLVFEDNLDASGEGIGALALDSNFNPVGSRFRVNQIRFGDQGRPQVALLSGGGTVFVWQSRPVKSARHIFGRWLSSSNEWLTGDTMINTFTRDSQLSPVIAALTNGNVLIAYGSRNQAAAGSMQDVYGQIFNATGGVVKTEFLVNQTIPYNQRNPSMAVLKDGRFVVAWVSEMQRQGRNSSLEKSSVDIYARLFYQDGAPAGNEILVNTESMNVCAEPAVTAGANGGFLVSWSELGASYAEASTNGGTNAYTTLDNAIRITNSWDVFARSFTPAGVTNGSITRLNDYRLGLQYGPQLAALDTGYLAVWTSYGQDGSAEGVYGRFLDVAGAGASAEFRVNSSTQYGQKYPAIGSDGSSRFLAAWSSYNAFPFGHDLYAQRYAAPGYIGGAPTTNYFAPVSDPFPTDVFPVDGGTNGPDGPLGLALNLPPIDTSTGPVSFTKGTFYGIFSDETNGLSTGSSGLFTATVSQRGLFTIKIVQGGKNYSGSGRFNANGRASFRVLRGSLRSLGVNLQMDPSGVQITGTASDTHWTATVVAFRSTFNRKSNPASDLAGMYTLQIPADAESTNAPAGAGVGSIKIDLGGKVTWSGSLADGTKITQATALFDSGYWPMYASLYSGGGCLGSWLQVTNGGVSGQCIWIKQGRLLSKYYPGGSSGGFTNVVLATGEFYSRPLRGQRALDWADSNGSLVLGSNERTLGSYSVRLDNNRIVGLAEAKLKLTVTPSTGLFKGVYTPSPGEKLQILGALLQGSQSGVGYYLGSKQNGAVILEAKP